jgi:hypothetical protein
MTTGIPRAHPPLALETPPTGFGRQVSTFPRMLASPQRPLKVLNAIPHLFRLVDLPEKFQGTNDLADGAARLVAVDETGVCDTQADENEEVLILGEEDTSLAQA